MKRNPDARLNWSVFACLALGMLLPLLAGCQTCRCSSCAMPARVSHVSKALAPVASWLRERGVGDGGGGYSHHDHPHSHLDSPRPLPALVVAKLEYCVLRDEMGSRASEEGESFQFKLPGLLMRSATGMDERAAPVQDTPRALQAIAWQRLGDEPQETLAS